MYNKNDSLFNKYDLSQTLKQSTANLFEEIDTYAQDYILNTSIEDICDYLENKYQIPFISLLKDKIHVKKHGEVDIDVSHDFAYGFRPESGPVFKKGTSITLAIPFHGDYNLFYCRGNTWSTSPPSASVAENELSITYRDTNLKPEKIRQNFDKEILSIEAHINYLKADVESFNKSLRHQIKERITARKEKYLNDLDIVSALGFPIKESADIPKTYIAPEIKKKLIIKKPAPTTNSFKPEPTLDLKIYEAILNIISNMVLVMERSPSSFKTMNEEALRQHFLVQLNGHFDGQASGETFNFEGKTDILIRSESKNIFIGECMFWKGAGSLKKKTDQLLGYTSWRDTKTAIIIFNRNKDLSNIINQISPVLQEHPNFKKEVPYDNETGFRFLMHMPNDKNRELILTVLIFDVPK